MIEELQHLSYEHSMRELRLFGLEKKGCGETSLYHGMVES